MMQRKRRMSLEELVETLPDIPVGQGGKGAFKFAKVLPGYLVAILEKFDAPLATAEFKSIFIAKLPFLTLPFRKAESDWDAYEEETPYPDATEDMNEVSDESAPIESTKKLGRLVWLKKGPVKRFP